MSGLASLEAAQGTLVEAFPACFRERCAARVGIIETAVRGAIDEDGAVELRGEGEDVEGWDGVDGVVGGGHVEGRIGLLCFCICYCFCAVGIVKRYRFNELIDSQNAPQNQAYIRGIQSRFFLAGFESMECMDSARLAFHQ